jgi:hypothetical protein
LIKFPSTTPLFCSMIILKLWTSYAVYVGTTSQPCSPSPVETPTTPPPWTAARRTGTLPGTVPPRASARAAYSSPRSSPSSGSRRPRRPSLQTLKQSWWRLTTPEGLLLGGCLCLAGARWSVDLTKR